MNRAEFKSRLRQTPLLLDGAMGTALHSQGVALDECFDALNVRQPAFVANVLREYIVAGADIVETNSFGANRFKLAAHGLEADLRRLNEAAVRVARSVIEASFQPVLLAGAIGPLGIHIAPLGRVSAAQAQEAFAEQMEALVRPGGGVAGVDLLIVETISSLKEAEVAIAAAREVAPDVPLVVQLSFTRDDLTLLGETPAEVGRRLSQLDVDVAGANCSGGPAQVLRLIKSMAQAAPELPLSAVPNAGWPEHTAGGRLIYPATPDYFGDYSAAFVQAGARIVGGCCGTGAMHIAAMRRALNEPPAETAASSPGPPRSGGRMRQDEVQSKTDLARALAEGQFVATVEIRPPKGIATQRMIAGARMLQEAGANFLNVADSPLARMRMSAWAAAHLIQQNVGIEAILHFPTRGRNLLRIQGDLLAAHAVNVRNLFIVMGDPTHIGDYPEAADNYDIVPSGLIQLIKLRLNSGVEQSGASIDRPTTFVAGCALNLQARDPQRELQLLRKKIENGADFALSQPVFEATIARDFLERCRRELGPRMIPLIAGIQPLYNSRNAEFLHNEVPGFAISDAYRLRMKRSANPQQEGVSIAQEILEEMQPHINGIYLVPQFGRYDIVANVLDVVKARTT